MTETLSDKIFWKLEDDGMILTKDVKKFIKDLKEAVRWKCGTHTDNGQFWLEKIDKLAGGKLV